MLNFLIALAATAFVLGVMILVHEWGHYIVAKLCGVRVEVFSVGFGRRLAGFRRGETDYRLSALPFGGYVKMSGENPMEERTGDAGEFMSHPRWQRFLIALAGPAMNILLAVTLLTGLYMFHFEHDETSQQPAVIGYVAPNSPAAKAGIQSGDRILRIGNVQDPKWEDVFTELVKAKMDSGARFNLYMQRGTSTYNTQLTPQKRSSQELDYVGWTPNERNLVVGLEPNMPAAAAGLQINDEVIALNGHAVHSMTEIRSLIQQNGAKPITFSVLRSGKTLSLTATPTLVQPDNEYRLGFRAAPPTRIDKLPFPVALRHSLTDNARASVLIVDMLQKLAERKASLKQMDGPIGIGRAAGEAARSGVADMAGLMAVISINLALFNLLPIPILDGGLMMLLLIEGLIRRDINQRLKERIYQTAFVFLVIFAVVVLYNDVSKLI